MLVSCSPPVMNVTLNEINGAYCQRKDSSGLASSFLKQPHTWLGCRCLPGGAVEGAERSTGVPEQKHCQSAAAGSSDSSEKSVDGGRCWLPSACVHI